MSSRAHKAYSSKSFRSDRITFLHHTNHANEDVEFSTSNNFNFVKPIKLKEIILNDKFKIIENSDNMIIQKKIAGVYTDYFSFS